MNADRDREFKALVSILAGCKGACALLAALLAAAPAAADWPAARGGAARTGTTPELVRPPFHVAWARHFAGERMSSGLEPILASGMVLVGTHSGSLYALEAASGLPAWRFQARGAFLGSPAAAGEIVVAASTDGFLNAVGVGTGKLLWSSFISRGGFSASPLVFEGAVVLGTRSGELVASDLHTGALRWRLHLGAPVRQSAAGHLGRIFVASEDLRVHCVEAAAGKLIWTSSQLEGQSARDCYPVIHEAAGRTRVIVRTSPSINMAKRIGRDRGVLAKSAGVDDGDWRKIDAWTKSDAARGTPELWEKEQAAIVRHLEAEPEARTFFVLDAETGKEAMTTPVLWCGGCQGVGSPPVALPGGKLLVFHRSAYGNWNHGVAPLVALGVLDLVTSRIEPLEHRRGRQPPWNTFWGTADESQSFTLARETLLIVHQSTLSGFDVTSGDLFPIAGERDGWGGFRNLPWARNEWNGPARGGVAVGKGRLYWQTGSRLLCIACGEEGQRATDVEVDGRGVPTTAASEPSPAGRAELGERLAAQVAELFSRRWAPLCLEPGLAGRETAFEASGEVFEALSLAYPHLPPELQLRAKSFLRKEWEAHPPFTGKSVYRIDEGERREYHRVPAASLSRAGHAAPYHPFGGLHAIRLYAERLDAWDLVRGSWKDLRTAFDAFVETKWRLDPQKGDLHANRYLASLVAFTRLAERAGDEDASRQAALLARETAEALAAWWRRSAERVALPVIKDIGEWDRFLGRGDALFFCIAPHKSKVALFHNLTPEVASTVKAKAPDAVEKVWRAFEALCPTWHLAGEERQVHYGENFTDPPDFSLDAFRAAAWLGGMPPGDLAERTDVPFCRADLGYIVKMALAIEAR